MGKLPPTQAGDAANGGEHGYSNPDQGMTKIASVPAQPVPLCSVLNTIVDHVMPTHSHGTTGISRGLAGQQQRERERTRTETWTRRRSYQHKKQTASNQWHWVPVMRIFGPVLRREATTMTKRTGNGDSTKRPTQSACLYSRCLSYMLARPATAGT
jgi:hypothetical protein